MSTTPLDVQREAIRTALLDIADQHHGLLNPTIVVEVARDPAHVLHTRFQWDDSLAAESWRRAQATALIRSVKLTITRPDHERRTMNISTTRAFQSRPSQRSAEGGYETIDQILGDETKRHELLGHVLAELNAYRKRYAELSELEAIWVAVDEALSDLRSEPSSPSATDGETQPGAAG